MTTNRLIHEKSPYLLQHAHNPVDWYPWGKEAFDKASREDKPIFLSIGYSTCHWCHVMERESFSDPAVAAILNEHFVSIKLDREERPDIDHLYMQAVMRMTGHGGWPLTVFLTPDLKPFYGGTYFPPEDRWGQPGLKALLRGVADAWKDRRQELLTAGQTLTEALAAQASVQVPGGKGLGAEVLKEAYHHYSQLYDETYGGFEPAPKFPRSHALSFLLRYWKRTRDPKALQMVEKTLFAMAAGGIYDHLGGGFHRYSTDAQWRVPHFEKMLYDQAILAVTYLETYQATGNPAYAQTAREIFEYLLRDLKNPAGGFSSAEDADSPIDANHPHEKGEGAFYVWTQEEVVRLLGSERAKIFNRFYGVEKNILYQAQGVEDQVRQALAESKQVLFQARLKRPRPHLDDKVLVDWNGLILSSLSLGSVILNEPRYLQAAEEAAQFILEKLVRKDGRLLHRWRDGEAGLPGTLDDYAFFIHGILDLYQVTGKPTYLAQAKRLTQEMVRLFWDESQGGFFLTTGDAEHLLVRQKDWYDGAIPSGNSVAALDLLRVGRLTMERSLEEKAHRMIEGFSGELAQNPSAYPQLLIALDFALGPSYEIVLAGAEGSPGMREMARTVYQPFLPNKVVAFQPFLKEQVALEGKPTAYVCQNYTCQLPTTNLEELRSLLEK